MNQAKFAVVFKSDLFETKEAALAYLVEDDMAEEVNSGLYLIEIQSISLIKNTFGLDPL